MTQGARLVLTRFVLIGVLALGLVIAAIVSLTRGIGPTTMHEAPLSITPSALTDAEANRLFLRACEETISGPSVCYCMLSWVEVRVPRSRFVQDVAMFVRFEQHQTGEPPRDVFEAYAACR